MDSRPGYRELSPPQGSGAGIVCLWVRVAGPTGQDTRVLPDACADLVWRAGTGAFVAGPDTGPVLSALAPGSVVVGARLGPGAGGNALGLPLSELRDLRVPVDELDPALASELPGDREPRQTHLTREFGRLAGLPPGALLRTWAM